MTVLIKLCGFTTAGPLRAAVAAGVDAVGFVFAESVREIDPKRAADLCIELPPSVQKIAVMRHPDNDRWQAVLRDFQPNVLQTDAEDFAQLDVPDSMQRWPVYREGGAAPDAAEAFVYEGRKSGQGETVDWSTAATLAKHGKLILAGGLSVQNIATAIATVRPFGVDVSSGIESAPGVKDAERIQKFVEAVRAAEKNL